MFHNFKYTFKQTVIYSFGNLSTKVIGLILLPLYTKYLTPTEYGIFIVLEATSQVMITVLALNLPMAMLRFCSSELDIAKQRSIIFTTTIALLAFLLLQMSLLLPSTHFFSNLIFGESKYSEYFYFLFLAIAFGVYNGLPLNLIRIREKPVYYIIANASKFLIILTVNIYLIVFQGEGILGIIKGQLIGEFFLAVLTLPVIFKNIVIKFHFHTLKEMLKYGVPLVFSAVSIFSISFADRYIMQAILDSASVGVYAIGYKFASVINILLLQSFQLGYVPIAYKKVGEKDEMRFFSKSLTYFTFLLVALALIISLFSKELVELIVHDSSFWLAISVIPILSLVFVFKGIQYVFSLSFHYAKSTVPLAIIIVITAIFNILLNFLLIPLWGFLGAAYSMLIATLLMMVATFYFGQRAYPIPYELKKITKIITLFIATILLVYLAINNFNFVFRLLAKLTLLFIFPFILYRLNFYEEVELLRIKQSWIKWRNPFRWKDNFKKINF